MIQRDITEELVRSAAEYPVVTILGPRQSGKTTLVQMTFPDRPYFCLEYPDVRAAAEAAPTGDVYPHRERPAAPRARLGLIFGAVFQACSLA